MCSRQYKQPNKCVHTSKYTAWTYTHARPCSHAWSSRVMARLLVANQDLREYCFQVKRLHASRPNGLRCMNTSTKLVCTYGYTHAYMHACMFPPRPARLCAARHDCAHARPPCIITPTCYREDIFHACMYAGRYVCMLPPRSAWALFSRRACSHARPPYIIAFTRYRRDIFYAHMCGRR